VTAPAPGAAAPSPTATPGASAPAPATAAPSADLFKQAESLEASDPKAAVKIYRSLARKGSGQAAKRLGDIYDRGIPGIPRDYQESLSWYQKARDLGMTIETAGKR
jgi:TPR repeat protein